MEKTRDVDLWDEDGMTDASKLPTYQVVVPG
jgi:hypothetical protein